MPTGLNIATCLHCGIQWVVGDCISFVCPVCEEAGHGGFGSSCPVCHSIDEERMTRIASKIEQAKSDRFDAGLEET